MKIKLSILLFVILAITTTAIAWESEHKHPPNSYDHNGDPRFDSEHVGLTSQALNAANAFSFMDYPPASAKDVCGTVKDFNSAALGWERLTERDFCPAGFSELPDFYHSMEDYINQGKKCPPLADWDAKECHKFEHFMGALNSTHFPPQLRTIYERYHDIAKAVVEHGNDLHSKLFIADALSKYGDYWKECQMEALTYESIGQHYLQDQWSMGHMWYRWGGPEVDDFQLSGLFSVLNDYPRPKLLYGTVIGGVAGLIHGWKSSVKGIWDTPPLTDDPMCFWVPGVDWIRDDFSEPFPGMGDLFIDQEGIFDQQIQEISECSEEGFRQVEAFRDSPATEVSDECWGNLATNKAMHIGLNMGPSAWVSGAVSRYAGDIGQILLGNGVGYQMYQLSVTYKNAAHHHPNDTYLAEGYTSKKRDKRLNLFSIKPNDYYNSLPSYTDPARNAPGDPADLTGVPPDNNLFGARQVKFFNKCHAELYCEDTSIVHDYRQGCLSEDNEYQQIDCGICEELASRFFLGDPPICEILSPQANPDPNNLNPPKTPEAVRNWCGTKLYWAEIKLVNYEETLDTWNSGQQTGEANTFYKGPVSLSEDGKYHAYSGIWDEGYPGTNYGGDILVIVDTETNSVVEFSAQNIDTWNCGGDIGQIIGRNENIEGPKPGNNIPLVDNSSGIYRVTGANVCPNYITDLNFKWGCPEFEDVLVSYSCNDTTYLQVEIYQRQP